MRALDRPLTKTNGMLSTASTSASGNDVSLRRRMSRSAPSNRLSAMAAWAPATEATGPITMPPACWTAAARLRAMGASSSTIRILRPVSGVSEGGGSIDIRTVTLSPGARFLATLAQLLNGVLFLAVARAKRKCGNDLSFSPFHDDLQGRDTMPDYDPKTDIHVTSGPP